MCLSLYALLLRTGDWLACQKSAEYLPAFRTRGPWWPWIAHLSHFPYKWILHLCSFGFNLWPPGWASFDPKGHLVNKIDKGLQGDATYRKSKLYLFQFQRRRILKLVFFVPMFQLVTQVMGSVLTPKNIWIKLIKVHKGMIKPNIIALILPVSEKMNFEVGFLCSYVPTCDPPGEASFDPISIILTNLVDVHREMLKTKYQSSIPSSFRAKEFPRWNSSFLFSNLWPTGWGQSWP